MEVLKDVIGVVAGTFIGGIVYGGIISINRIIFPIPYEIDPKVVEERAQLILDLPIGALLMVPLAFALASFFGGMFTAKISGQPKIIYALITGGFLMLAGVSTLVQTPHPTWMVVMILVVFFPAAFLGGKLMNK